MNKYVELIKKFKDKNVLIVGDLMVDKFVHGTVGRISPEAPVPVVEVTKETDLPGGAGNVANNVSELKAKVHMLSVIGRDLVGDNLRSFLNSRNIDTNGVIEDEERPTTIKTRIVAQHQQVVRVDKESKTEISHKITEKILDYLEKNVPLMDAVIISDYGKGMIKPKVLQGAIELARKNRIPITVDPKIEHFLAYKKVTCITPNLSEAVNGMRLHKVSTEKEIIDLGFKILDELQCESVIITRGEKGMSIFEAGKHIHIPTRAKEVYDVTGAGDTVISVLTLCLASGAPLRISAELANYAAGIVVAKLGTATVTVDELAEAVKNL